MIDEPLPEIPERQNDKTREPRQNVRAKKRNPEENNSRRGTSVKQGKRPQDLLPVWGDYRKRPNSAYTMEYLAIPHSAGSDGPDGKRKISSSDDSNNTNKRRSTHGPHGSTPTNKSPPAALAPGANDSNEFFDTLAI